MTKKLFIANPDATNSELDAKVIIKNQPELTESQRDELTEQFVEIVVDGTGDFDTWDYVSEWTEWEGVDMSLLFQIHRTCLHLKQDHHNSLNLVGV